MWSVEEISEEDDKKIMGVFDNIKSYHPDNEEDLNECFNYSLKKELATYINLKR